MKIYLVIQLLILAIPGFGHSVTSFHSLTDTTVVAQLAGKWIVRGTVVDSATKQAIPYATLRLYEAELQKTFSNINADDQGQFSVLVSTACHVDASSVGFMSKSTPVYRPVSDEPITLQIALRATATTIQAVTVRAGKPIVEEQIDRIVYHADRDIMAQGGLATDILRKVPLVTVLPDGGLLVRGATNVKILVNGRTSVLSTNPAELLRQIPAESIKTIEVITSPSARYDAEGSTLINIVTKKDLVQGINATINGGIGSTGSNAATSLSANYKKVSISTGLTGNWFYNPFAAVTDLYQIKAGERQRVISQQANGRMGIQVANAYANVEYRLSDKTRLMVGMNHRIRQVITDRDAQFTGTSDTSTLAGGHFESRIQSNTNDWNVEYTHTFGRAQQELTVAWTAGITRNQTLLTSAAPVPTDTRSQNNEQIFQADYQHPIRRNWLIETGIRWTTRRISNSVGDSTAVRISTLQYWQQVRAAYVSSQWDLKNKWSLRAGLRLEQTSNTIDQSTYQSGNDYLNLFPNMLVQKRLKNARSVKFSYGLRIQRPPAQYLNPAVASTDPVSRYAGSPWLQPERIQTADISYSTYIKGSSLIMSSFIRHTTQPISPYNTLGGTTLLTQFVNLNSQTDIGVNLYASFKCWQRWQTIATANVYYTSLVGGAALGNLINQGTNYTLGTMSTYELAKTWAMQLYGGYNSARVRLQGSDAAFAYYQLSLRKSLPHQKGSIALGIDNPFRNRAMWSSYNETSTFAYRSTSYQYNRGIRLTLVYRIGKSSARQESAKSRERRQSDLKEDQ